MFSIAVIDDDDDKHNDMHDDDDDQLDKIEEIFTQGSYTLSKAIIRDASKVCVQKCAF